MKPDISLSSNGDGTWTLSILSKSWKCLSYNEALEKITEYEQQKEREKDGLG